MPATADRIAAVRRFNRFYTRRIGVLQEGLLDTRWSLTESRLLWELAHRGTTTATALGAALELDPGYVSRLVAGFKARGLLRAQRAKDDARNVHLTLTAAGRRAFAPLDARSQRETQRLLDMLPESRQEELVGAMNAIERLLGGGDAGAAPVVLRPHRPGDIGWVVSRNGALYAQEFGWDATFEAMVAHIAARFIEQFDARRECCWIAERDGAAIGSVFLVQARDDATDAPQPGIAQLRMLLVEPAARGLRVGEALVRECERFARQCGYRTIRLWTNSVLLAARGLYARAGYRLIASEPHASFGQELVGETWELALR